MARNLYEVVLKLVLVVNFSYFLSELIILYYYCFNYAVIALLILLAQYGILPA